MISTNARNENEKTTFLNGRKKSICVFQCIDYYFAAEKIARKPCASKGTHFMIF